MPSQSRTPTDQTESSAAGLRYSLRSLRREWAMIVGDLFDSPVHDVRYFGTDRFYDFPKSGAGTMEECLPYGPARLPGQSTKVAATVLHQCKPGLVVPSP